jgi:hypothetical protein
VITIRGMISDEFALEVLRALSRADRFGMALHDLAMAVWPDKERDARQHSVLGAALAELGERGHVISSGGKKARYALSSAGERWVAGYRVTPGAPPPAAFVAPPPSAGPADPIAAAIEAIMLEARAPDGMPADTSWAERNARIRAMAPIKHHRQTERLRAACGADPVLFDMAEAELQRRIGRRILEIEARCRAAGVDPHGPEFYA